MSFEKIYEIENHMNYISKVCKFGTSKTYMKVINWNDKYVHRIYIQLEYIYMKIFIFID
jgi:hypothetical protein